MTKLLPLVFKNLRRSKRNLVFSSIGILVGTGLFTFFFGLTQGIQQNVLNRLYPVNQIEVEPRSVSFMGIKERASADLVIDDELLERIRRIPSVAGAFPKQRSKFQARLWGGQDLFGRVLHLEAFFDGVSPELLTDELQDNEGMERRRIKARYKKRIPCTYDLDCRAGEICEAGACEDKEYWRLFRDQGEMAWCEGDGQCVVGQRCVAGGCVLPCDEGGACAEGMACVDDACRPACAEDAACAPGLACVDGGCERLRCTLAKKDDQYESSAKTRGRLVSDPERPCPLDTYCAARSVTTTEGACEEPIAALLNPFILTIYNSTAAVALGVPRIDGVDLVLGLRFRILYGNSFFVRDVKPEQQVVKQCVIAGFSTKALEMGVTMPLPYVRRVNARFKGGQAASEYNSVIVETAANEQIPAAAARLKAFGFELNEKSKSARKAGNMLFILTMLFVFISGVILAVSAINITHTFMLIVVQRRREIGVLRSVGATRGHVRALFLLESVFVGLFGSLLGNGLALGLGALVDSLAARYFQGLPFVPERLFVFEPSFFAASAAVGVAFCVIGALVPANRAAGLDPTVALRGE
jgi:ABC-type lipoprotein release transport system permease subunit